MSTREVGKQRKGASRGALGKGISSLLGDAVESARTPTQPQGLATLSPHTIDPNPHQPRKIFEDDGIHELSASIKEDGILQPLVVTAGDKPGRYILIAGERRLRAAKMAKLDKVPVIIKESCPNDMLRLALIENIQRRDLNIVEEAQAYDSLIKDFGLTQEQCAAKVGKDRSTVTNALRILDLPQEVREDLVENRITMGHGRALLPLADKKLILRARDIVIKKNLSVRQTEQLVKNLRQSDSKDFDSGEKQIDQDLEYVANNLRSLFKTKVRLSGTGQRGKIEISYFSAAELERILSIVGPKL